MEIGPAMVFHRGKFWRNEGRKTEYVFSLVDQVVKFHIPKIR